jgi:DNA-binding protein HU-beta
MTKAELLEAVAKKAGTTKADAEKVVDAFFDVVVATTKKGGKAGWPGFGAFTTSKTKARMGRNPRTGEKVKIAATTRMRFAPSSTLRTALNPRKAK